MQWITESLLITGKCSDPHLVIKVGDWTLLPHSAGSRDSTMALWSISPLEESKGHLAEEVPIMEPIFKLTNISTDSMKDYTLAGERVRSLTYNKYQYVSHLPPLGRGGGGLTMTNVLS